MQIGVGCQVQPAIPTPAAAAATATTTTTPVVLWLVCRRRDMRAIGGI